MRLLITADLHYNHARSRPLAEDLIDQMNAAGGDILLVVGDTAAADTDALERCLSRFTFKGPKLFIAGNHELWTAGPDSYELFRQTLPARVRNLGWHWLEADPFVAGSLAIVGTIGWYDYSFAPEYLGIPQRFYAHKIAPGSAEHYSEFAHLFNPSDDISPIGRATIARWNDGRFVKLHRPDPVFLDELLTDLQHDLNRLTAHQSPPTTKQIISAVHHLPTRELLPPPRNAQWDFAKTYLGSDRIGHLLRQYPQVTHTFCGHSHLPGEAILPRPSAPPLQIINIGSGYRWKTYETLEVTVD